MPETFAVHIGGGAYLDAAGHLVFAPPPGVQVYEGPKGLSIDTKKLQDTFKDLSDILPRDEDGKKKWKEWGVPDNLVNGLGALAGVAGIVATAISVYMWVLGVMLAIMDLMSEDDGMSPALAQVLFNIKSQLQGLEQIQRADVMIQLHSEFDGRIDLMYGLVTRLLVEKPVGPSRAAIFADMRHLVDQLSVPLSRLRDQAWTATYDTEAYKARAFASHRLVFQHSDGTLAPVPMASPNVTVFDYRLGVPMLLYGATAFTGLLQVAMPWFRTAGLYASQLRKTADAIDRFVIRMQDESLARTEYTGQSILEEEISRVYDVVTGEGGPSDAIQHPYPCFAVGAFDLVSCNDAFMWDRFAKAFPTGVDLGVRGLFNYKWFPPPDLSLDDIAIAANEQSRMDYARLQVATGMFRLVSTAAWLRYLSTPTDRSQTVSGTTGDTRYKVDELPTTARSPSIFPVGVIEHAATLKRYEARARVRLTVQEPGHVPAFRYRVVLRAIESLSGNAGWDSTPYVGRVWTSEYVPTHGDPRNKRLRTEVRPGSILGEVVLFEGPSPVGAVVRNGTATLSATTFDWYVPVVSAGSDYLEAVNDLRTAAMVRSTRSAGAVPNESPLGTGGVSIHLRKAPGFAARSATVSAAIRAVTSDPTPMHVMGGPAPFGRDAFDTWDVTTSVALSEASLDDAERRHVSVEEEVQVRWELAWNGDKVEVRLFGNPQQRPFQLHVVVEEDVFSGESIPDGVGGLPDEPQFRERIHTPYLAEIVNQLVFVPERFFEKEREAIAKGAKMWREFIRRFSESRVAGPGDPIEFLLESNRALLARSPSTATLALMIDEQVQFAEREAPRMWQEAVRGVREAGREVLPELPTSREQVPTLGEGMWRPHGRGPMGA
jgi:hypothetical protein